MALLRRQQCFPRITFLLSIQLLQQVLISHHQGSGAQREKAVMKSQKQSRCHSGLKCWLKTNVKQNNIFQQNCPVCVGDILKAVLQFFFTVLFVFQNDWSKYYVSIL
jgi:hypothetical protein